MGRGFATLEELLFATRAGCNEVAMAGIRIIAIRPSSINNSLIKTSTCNSLPVISLMCAHPLHRHDNGWGKDQGNKGDPKQ